MTTIRIKTRATVQIEEWWEGDVPESEVEAIADAASGDYTDYREIAIELVHSGLRFVGEHKVGDEAIREVTSVEAFGDQGRYSLWEAPNER